MSTTRSRDAIYLPKVRFGLVNVNFTVGYAFNVQQRAGEPRGAAVIGLMFENLF